MKKVIVSLGAIALSGLMASTVFAGSITNNGSDSSIKTSLESNTTTTVKNTNEADVTNNVDTISQTGGNEVSVGHGDIKGVTLVTGDASAKTSVSNAVNGIDSTVTAPSCGCNAKGPKITNNSSDSSIKSKVDLSNEVTVKNSNDSTVTNNIDTKSKTGGNEIGTHHGDIADLGVLTGMTMSKTKIGNLLNFTSSVVTR